MGVAVLEEDGVDLVVVVVVGGVLIVSSFFGVVLDETSFFFTIVGDMLFTSLLEAGTFKLEADGAGSSLRERFREGRNVFALVAGERAGRGGGGARGWMGGGGDSGRGGSSGVEKMAASICVERRLRVPRSVFCDSVVGVAGAATEVFDSEPTDRNFGRASRVPSASFLSCEGDIGSGMIGWPMTECDVWTVMVVATPEWRFDGVRLCAYGRSDVMLI